MAAAVEEPYLACVQAWFGPQTTGFDVLMKRGGGRETKEMGSGSFSSQKSIYLFFILKATLSSMNKSITAVLLGMLQYYY